jgi:hypothetical protein
MPHSRFRVPDLGLLLLALLIRIAALAAHPVTRSLFSDMHNYSSMADEIAQGLWKPTHFFQPVGFAYLLSLFRRLPIPWGTTLGLYQLVLSTATVGLVWRSADRAFGPRAARLALLVAAVHAPWVLLSTLTLPETTFTFLLAVLVRVGLELIERPAAHWAALWGGVFIAAFWIKGTHVFLGPLFVLGVLAWKHWSRDVLLRVAMPLCGVVAAGLLLHGVITLRTIGRFQMTASAGGLNFVEGKCPSKRNFDSTGAQWYSPIYAQLGITTAKMWDRPFTDSSYFMKEGLKCIRDNPLVLVESLEGIPFLVIGNFMWPGTQISIAPLMRLYELCFAPWLIVGLAVWLRRRWPVRAAHAADLIVWLLPLIALCVCVYVFKSESRFRVPFDVWLIPMAAQGWTLLWAEAAPADRRSGVSVL